MPDAYRYLYFVMSTLKFLSYAEWKAEGEPNPFLRDRPRLKTRTNQQEMIDIFKDHGIG